MIRKPSVPRPYFYKTANSGLPNRSTTSSPAAMYSTNGTIGVTKDGYQINAITGSTITSRAVCDGVNAARHVVEALG